VFSLCVQHSHTHTHTHTHHTHTQHNQTPIHQAALLGESEIIGLLLEKHPHAKLNTKDNVCIHTLTHSHTHTHTHTHNSILYIYMCVYCCFFWLFGM